MQIENNVMSNSESTSSYLYQRLILFLFSVYKRRLCYEVWKRKKRGNCNEVLLRKAPVSGLEDTKSVKSEAIELCNPR